jgi:hypothetical protein
MKCKKIGEIDLERQRAKKVEKTIKQADRCRRWKKTELTIGKSNTSPRLIEVKCFRYSGHRLKGSHSGRDHN